MSRVRMGMSAGIACFASAMLLGVAASGFGGQGTGKSIRDGVYTKAQANRGGTTFAARCTACHGDPNFGPSVIDSRDGTAVAELFTFMSTAMPEDNPGSLRPEEYAEIVAYFISSRGLPPGAADLPADVETLKQIRIEKPPEDAANRR
jgi:mono/diheme cytochrome c family protein